MKIDKEWEHVLIPQHYFRPVFITFIKYNQLKVHEPFILKLLESSGFPVFFSLCNISGIMFGFSLFMLAVFKIKTSNDHMVRMQYYQNDGKKFSGGKICNKNVEKF